MSRSTYSSELPRGWRWQIQYSKALRRWTLNGYIMYRFKNAVPLRYYVGVAGTPIGLYDYLNKLNALNARVSR